MITYRMMDETCLLPACLHGGPVSLASLRTAPTTATPIETQEGITAGTLARFLQALCQRYDSAAVLAIDDDTVVGKLRFAPAQVERLLSGICFQQAAEVKRIAQLDLDTLPDRRDLQEQRIRLDCFQVAESYHGQGIAKNLLDTVIAWAREKRWESLSTSAIRHIPPLLNWSGQASVKAMQARGFVITSEMIQPDLREGVISQRAGHHGEAVQQQWTEFADLSDDDAAVLYEMELRLPS